MYGLCGPASSVCCLVGVPDWKCRLLIIEAGVCSVLGASLYPVGVGLTLAGEVEEETAVIQRSDSIHVLGANIQPSSGYANPRKVKDTNMVSTWFIFIPC